MEMLLKYIDRQIEELQSEKVSLVYDFDDFDSEEELMEHARCSMLSVRKEGAIDTLKDIRKFIESEYKSKCNCNKEVDVYNLQDNFEYVGCNDKNNPTFKCKICGVCLYG